jgi:hypothetical protein
LEGHQVIEFQLTLQTKQQPQHIAALHAQHSTITSVDKQDQAYPLLQVNFYTPCLHRLL